MSAPELLFNPAKFDLSCKSIPDMACASIYASEVSLAKEEIANNIILSGGSSMFEGLQERLSKEIFRIAPTGAQIRVITDKAEKRGISTWIGASCFASLSAFNTYVISKDDYYESDARIVHKKCA